MTRERIPTPVTNERSDRATAEQCRLDHNGNRCVHVKGHAGPHHSVGNRGCASWSDEETKPK
jgi:hypothetical protein